MKTAFLMSCVLLACYCSARPIDIDACIVGDPNSVGGAFNETVISNSLVEASGDVFSVAFMHVHE